MNHRALSGDSPQASPNGGRAARTNSGLCIIADGHSTQPPNGLVVDLVFHLHDLSLLAFLDDGGDAVPVQVGILHLRRKA